MTDDAEIIEGSVRSEYRDCISNLYNSALKSDQLGFLYTILRISGEHYGHWDPFEEFFRAMDDYDWILNESRKASRENAEIRIGLLMYCNLVEISSVHEILANLLRCQATKPFLISPFSHLYRRKKKGSSIPPSAKTKFGELKRLADETRNAKLVEIIDEIFNDNIRNSFVHADYCLTTDEFRSTHGRSAASVKLDNIWNVINRAFIFYNEFIKYFKFTKKQTAKARKYHKLKNYEVLELLSNEHGLFGFKMHFSNGSSAYFERHPERVEAVNLNFNSDGSIGFMVGSIDDLEKVWKVNGTIVDDFDKLNGQETH